MDNKCRGTVCIINVFKVHGMAPRNGTNVDRERLKELFEQLHFHVVVFNDEDGLSASVGYVALVVYYCVRVVCTIFYPFCLYFYSLTLS